MPSRVWISIPRHSLACFTRATRRVILCPPPSSSHAKDYRLFAHRPQSHVSPARISLRRMRSLVAQAQSSKIPLTMRCPGPDKVKEQKPWQAAYVWKRETRSGTSTRRLCLFVWTPAPCMLQSWRPQVVDLVAPINHDAILILAREYSRGYSSFLLIHRSLLLLFNFIMSVWRRRVAEQWPQQLVQRSTPPGVDVAKERAIFQRCRSSIPVEICPRTQAQVPSNWPGYRRWTPRTGLPSWPGRARAPCLARAREGTRAWS